MAAHTCAKRRWLVALATLVILTGAAGSAGAETTVNSGPNLIVNGDAEAGAAAGSGYDAVTIPGWQISGLPTVVRYGQHTDGVTGTANSPRGLNPAGTFPTASTPGPGDRGRQLFVGGSVASDALTQTDSLLPAAGAIDHGGVHYTLAAWLGGNATDTSDASVTVSFLNAGGSKLAGATIGPVAATDRLLSTKLLQRSATGTIPPGTRSARVTLTLTDGNRPNVALTNSYNNAYADDLSLHVSTAVPAPPAPAVPFSRLGRLDHVFMIFLENEGDGDIVGNSAAPYINRLIDHYGLATSYYAIEHPSDPNYIALFGGQTSGIDADCALACTVNAPNLADRIEAVNKTWAFYEETMPAPCYKSDSGPSGSGGSYYTPDLLPWPYFADIADNSARCQAHVLPLTRMAPALASTRTTPNFVWFEADDCDDMEQCGIAPGDTWLSRTLPTILNSPAFRTQRSAVFVTWDEDNNNKSFNEDNQDQRVPLIVIPSARSGMLTGPVRDPTYYTHYSLTRTIEQTLGLATLTDNDRFATPLNDFWPAIPALSAVRPVHNGRAVRFRDTVTGSVSLVVYRLSFGRLDHVRTVLHSAHPGLNGVSLGKHRLAPGRYQVWATAHNTAGLSSSTMQRSFAVKR
jgi:hypothetical protein